MSKAHQNSAVMDTFKQRIHTGVMTLTFSRRDIIEAYMLGKFPYDDAVAKLDLHSGNIGLMLQIFKKDGVITHAEQNYLR